MLEIRGPFCCQSQKDRQSVFADVTFDLRFNVQQAALFEVVCILCSIPFVFFKIGMSHFEAWGIRLFLPPQKPRGGLGQHPNWIWEEL